MQDMEDEEREVAALLNLHFAEDLAKFKTRAEAILLSLERMKVDCRYWDFFEDRDTNKHSIFEAWVALTKLVEAFDKKDNPRRPCLSEG